MAEGLIFLTAEILIRPSAFFPKVRDGTLMQAALFFFTLLCLHSILAGVMIRGGFGALFCGVPFIGTTPAGAESIIAAIAGSFLFGMFFFVIAGVCIHLTAVALGAENNMQETFRATLYGATPALLIGWIPLFGIIGIIWSLAVTTIGMRELQGLSIIRAISAVLIPAAFIIGLCSFVIAPFFFGYDYSRFFLLPTT